MDGQKKEAEEVLFGAKLVRVECRVYFKSGECYVFFWTKENEAALAATLGRFAANPELSFSWDDAARIIGSVTNTVKE